MLETMMYPIPIDNPPTMLASVPGTEIPPLVPGGTSLKLVINRGVVATLPNSLAKVSPQQQANTATQNNEAS